MLFWFTRHVPYSIINPPRRKPCESWLCLALLASTEDENQVLYNDPEQSNTHLHCVCSQCLSSHSIHNYMCPWGVSVLCPYQETKKNFGNLKLIAEKRTQHYAKYLYFSENSKLMAINWKLETRRYVVFSLITVNIHFFFYSLVQTL